MISGMSNSATDAGGCSMVRSAVVDQSSLPSGLNHLIVKLRRPVSACSAFSRTTTAALGWTVGNCET